MLTAQSRYAMFLIIVALLLGGLAPVSASAQTGDEPAFVDSMDGQTEPLLLQESPDPSLFVYRYALGQYTMQALDPAHSGDVISYIQAGPFGDSRTAVDAVIDLGVGGERSDQYLIVGCRAGADNNGYAFRLMPATGGASLWRLDADGAAELATGDASASINAAGEVNRIEIECAGDAISGTVNGEVAVSATDGTYASGTSYLGAGTPAEFAGTIFAAFDNLEIFELAGAQTEQAAEEEPTEEASTDEESVDAPSGALDAAALETAVIDYAVTVGPVAGPFVEDVMLTNGALRVLPAGVDVSNFHTEVRFVVPVDAPPGAWSIGFCFWVDPAGNCYDLFVSSDGATAEWAYARSAPTGESEVLESGPITGLDLTPGISNFIGLSVVDDTGILIVNSPEPAVSFAIDSPGGTGDIVRWLAFEAADPADTRSFTMSTDEFSVWDLSGMPPLSGEPAEPAEATPEAEVTEEPTATVESEETEEPATPASEETEASAEVTEAAEATATPEETEAAEVTATEEETEEAETVATPEEEPEATATEEVSANEATPEAEPGEGAETGDADNPFGVALGESLAGPFSGELIETDTTIETFLAGVDVADFYVRVDVVVPAEAAEPWDFTIGFRDYGDNDQYRFTIVSDGTWTLAYGDEEPFDSGEVDNLLVAPGEVNTIELVADLDGGEVALNGERFTSVFLTEVLDAGDIWIAAAANFETTSVGRVTEFRDFQVFEIE